MNKNHRNTLFVSLFLLLASALAGVQSAIAQKPEDYTPKPVPIGDHQSIQFTGSDFQDKLVVTLEDPNGRSFDAQTTSVKVPTEVSVTADLKVAGSWKAVFRNPNGQASAPFIFTVQAPSPKEQPAPLSVKGIIPIAPVLAPNQSLTFAGSGFGSDKSKLSISFQDPQGYAYPPTELLDAKDDRIVAVATLGMAGRWKATITRKNASDKGEASDTLEFGVANVPQAIGDFTSPAFVGFGLACLVATVLLGLLVGLVWKWLGKAIQAGRWSLADALSEESGYQPRVVTMKSDVILLASTSRVIALVQPGGKKNPFSVRFDWTIMLPYAQTTLPEE